MGSKGKSQSAPAVLALRDLSVSVGDFIRYWGFRRVHGSIWTQLYLSKVPLSCTDLTKRLKSSKALISPALSELEDWKLIQKVPSKNDKIKLFQADPNVMDVIQHVLKMREQVLLKRTATSLNEFCKKDYTALSVDESRVEDLRQMVEAAQLMLSLILKSDDLLSLPDQVATIS